MFRKSFLSSFHYHQKHHQPSSRSSKALLTSSSSSSSSSPRQQRDKPRIFTQIAAKQRLISVITSNWRTFLTSSKTDNKQAQLVAISVSTENWSRFLSNPPDATVVPSSHHHQVAADQNNRQDRITNNNSNNSNNNAPRLPTNLDEMPRNDALTLVTLFCFHGHTPWALSCWRRCFLQQGHFVTKTGNDTSSTPLLLYPLLALSHLRDTLFVVEKISPSSTSSTNNETSRPSETLDKTDKTGKTTISDLLQKCTQHKQINNNNNNNNSSNIKSLELASSLMELYRTELEMSIKANKITVNKNHRKFSARVAVLVELLRATLSSHYHQSSASTTSTTSPVSISTIPNESFWLSEIGENTVHQGQKQEQQQQASRRGVSPAIIDVRRDHFVIDEIVKNIFRFDVTTSDSSILTKFWESWIVESRGKEITDEMVAMLAYEKTYRIQLKKTHTDFTSMTQPSYDATKSPDETIKNVFDILIHVVETPKDEFFRSVNSLKQWRTLAYHIQTISDKVEISNLSSISTIQNLLTKLESTLYSKYAPTADHHQLVLQDVIIVDHQLVLNALGETLPSIVQFFSKKNHCNQSMMNSFTSSCLKNLTSIIFRSTLSPPKNSVVFARNGTHYTRAEILPFKPISPKADSSMLHRCEIFFMTLCQLSDSLVVDNLPPYVLLLLLLRWPHNSSVWLLAIVENKTALDKVAEEFFDLTLFRNNNEDSDAGVVAENIHIMMDRFKMMIRVVEEGIGASGFIINEIFRIFSGVLVKKLQMVKKEKHEADDETLVETLMKSNIKMKNAILELANVFFSAHCQYGLQKILRVKDPVTHHTDFENSFATIKLPLLQFLLRHHHSLIPKSTIWMHLLRFPYCPSSFLLRSCVVENTNNSTNKIPPSSSVGNCCFDSYTEDDFQGKLTLLASFRSMGVDSLTIRLHQNSIPPAEVTSSSTDKKQKKKEQEEEIKKLLGMMLELSTKAKSAPMLVLEALGSFLLSNVYPLLAEIAVSSTPDAIPRDQSIALFENEYQTLIQVLVNDLNLFRVKKVASGISCLILKEVDEQGVHNGQTDHVDDIHPYFRKYSAATEIGGKSRKEIEIMREIAVTISAIHQLWKTTPSGEFGADELNGSEVVFCHRVSKRLDSLLRRFVTEGKKAMIKQEDAARRMLTMKRADNNNNNDNIINTNDTTNQQQRQKEYQPSRILKLFHQIDVLMSAKQMTNSSSSTSDNTSATIDATAKEEGQKQQKSIKDCIEIVRPSPAQIELRSVAVINAAAATSSGSSSSNSNSSAVSSSHLHNPKDGSHLLSHTLSLSLFKFKNKDTAELFDQINETTATPTSSFSAQKRRQNLLKRNVIFKREMDAGNWQVALAITQADLCAPVKRTVVEMHEREVVFENLVPPRDFWMGTRRAIAACFASLETKRTTDDYFHNSSSNNKRPQQQKQQQQQLNHHHQNSSSSSSDSCWRGACSILHEIRHLSSTTDPGQQVFLRCLSLLRRTGRWEEMLRLISDSSMAKSVPRSLTMKFVADTCSAYQKSIIQQQQRYPKPNFSQSSASPVETEADTLKKLFAHLRSKGFPSLRGEDNLYAGQSENNTSSSTSSSSNNIYSNSDLLSYRSAIASLGRSFYRQDLPREAAEFILVATKLVRAEEAKQDLFLSGMKKIVADEDLPHLHPTSSNTGATTSTNRDSLLLASSSTTAQTTTSEDREFYKNTNIVFREVLRKGLWPKSDWKEALEFAKHNNRDDWVRLVKVFAASSSSTTAEFDENSNEKKKK